MKSMECSKSHLSLFGQPRGKGSDAQSFQTKSCCFKESCCILFDIPLGIEYSAMSTECIPARNLLELVLPALHNWQLLFTMWLKVGRNLPWLVWPVLQTRSPQLYPVNYNPLSGEHLWAHPWKAPHLAFSNSLIATQLQVWWLNTSGAFSHWECLILEPWAVSDLQVVGRETWWHGASDGGFELLVSQTEILENFINLMASATSRPRKTPKPATLLGKSHSFCQLHPLVITFCIGTKTESQPRTNVQHRRHYFPMKFA